MFKSCIQEKITPSKFAQLEGLYYTNFPFCGHTCDQEWPLCSSSDEVIKTVHNIRDEFSLNSNTVLKLRLLMNNLPPTNTS